MKFFFSHTNYYFCFCWFGQLAESTLYVKSNDLLPLSTAVKEIMEASFYNYAETLNLIKSDGSVKVVDFDDSLLKIVFGNPEVIIRQELVSKLASNRQRRNVILLAGTFDDFRKFYQKMSPKLFKFSGFYLIVLINNETHETQNIFQFLWSIQVFKVLVIYETADGSVPVETFMPFRSGNCNNTTPITIDTFKNGEFFNNKTNLFSDKMKNLNRCKVRVSLGNNSEPFVVSKLLSNGSYKLEGTDIKILNALSESLNFRIDYVYIGRPGYLFENGSSEGPLRHLIEGEADLSITLWWLKMSRLKFLDATTSYLNDQIVLVVPPGREWTALEKLILPFSFSLWLLILACLLVGLFVIYIIKRQSTAIQNFVFGSGVANPYLSMLVGLIGGSQSVLPKRNFARFLLMMFLLYSVVIRTVYQGSFYHLMQSGSHDKEVQSIEEMIEKDFTFYAFKGNEDAYEGIVDAKR